MATKEYRALRRVDVPLDQLPADPRNPLTAPRTESFFVEHLDEKENLLGVLDGVTGGSVEANANRPKRRSGNLHLRKPADIAWAKDRLRVWKKFTALGQEFQAPLGTFRIKSPEEAFDDGSKSRQIQLIDKIRVIERIKLQETFSVEPGQNVTELVAGLIRDTGETNISVTHSDATVANPREWQPSSDNTLLQVINDLLGSIGYWAVYTDPMGAYQIQPYVDPRARPVSYRFLEGKHSIHLPAWTRSQDIDDVPNRFTVYSREDDDGNVLMAVATNTNPASPTSYQARGNRWEDDSEHGVETDSQEYLESLAQRRLLDRSSPPGAVVLNHAWLPDLELNDAVQLRSQGYEGLCTVTKMTVDLTPGSLVQAEWREVPLL